MMFIFIYITVKAKKIASYIQHFFLFQWATGSLVYSVFLVVINKQNLDTGYTETLAFVLAKG